VLIQWVVDGFVFSRARRAVLRAVRSQALRATARQRRSVVQNLSAIAAFYHQPNERFKTDAAITLSAAYP